jgi:autotransporter passenger strand-loop-strand repeat protein
VQAGGLVVSNGVLVRQAQGGISVAQNVSGVVVGDASEVYLLPGVSADSTTVTSGGTELVGGGASIDSILSSGGIETILGGTDSNTTVDNGGFQNMSSGATTTARR